MSLVAPPHRLVAEPAREGRVRLGMPHLALRGLSEGWLMKQLGDVHWQMLAERLGRPPSAVEDREGNRVYAAFRQLRLEAARLHLAREDDALLLRSRLWRLSRTQLISQHRLAIGGEAVGGEGLGTVTLVSAFIRREGGSNRRVCRVEVPGLAELPLWEGFQPEPPPQAAEEGEALPDFAFTPCPVEDFNGAGFLYFPAYAGIAERALHAARPALALASHPRERLVRFHANIDPGDSVRVTTRLIAAAAAAGQLQVRSLLHRVSDDALMAEIATTRHAAEVPII